jgi:hypothetical protein
VTSHSGAVARGRAVLSDVRYWHLADVDGLPINVCFRGLSGHSELRRECPQMTINAQRLFVAPNGHADHAL